VGGQGRFILGADWLGRGIYFWEYAPKQALTFAKIRKRQFRTKKNQTPEDVRRATEPLAVVACMIPLGVCQDLAEPENVEYLREIFDDYSESMNLAGAKLPKNSRKYRRLDCAVFEYAYKEPEPNSRWRRLVAEWPSVGLQVALIAVISTHSPIGGARVIEREWGCSWLRAHARGLRG
jgi:hypothetical protein